MIARPTIPNPHTHTRDLRAFAWNNRLAGFGVGCLFASAGWILLLATFGRTP